MQRLNANWGNIIAKGANFEIKKYRTPNFVELSIRTFSLMLDWFVLLKLEMASIYIKTIIYRHSNFTLINNLQYILVLSITKVTRPVVITVVTDIIKIELAISLKRSSRTKYKQLATVSIEKQVNLISTFLFKQL